MSENPERDNGATSQPEPQAQTGETSATPTPPPTPTGEAAPAAQPPPDPNAPVYAPGTPGIPSYLQGKNSQEVAQLVAQMGDALAAGQSWQQPTPQSTAQNGQYNAPPAPNGQSQPLAMPTQDLWMSDPDAAQNQLYAYTQQQLTSQVQPRLQQTSQQLASLARAQAASAHADAFQRWGPEVDILIQSMPIEQRTYEMYEQAVNVVRGRHADELANETAERLVQERLAEMQEAGTLRSGGAAGGASALPANELNLESDTLRPEVAEAFHHNQINSRTVDEFLLTRKPYGDMPLEAMRKKYYAAISKGSAATAEVS